MNEPRKPRTCAIDPLRFMRNTIQLGDGAPTVGGTPSRMGFFTCMWCDYSNGDMTGVLLEGNKTHTCGSCGRSLIMWIRL